MRETRRYISSLAASTFIVLAACDNNKDRSAEDEAAQPVESDSLVAADMPSGDGGPDEQELAIADDPSAVLASILEIEDQDERLDRGAEFFTKLAQTQPELALRLLPESLSSSQQERWGLPVLTFLLLNGSLEESALLTRSRFGGEYLNRAVGKCFSLLGSGDFSPDQMLNFWEMMGEGSFRDLAVEGFTEALARKDPILAVTWLESFESEWVPSKPFESIVGRTREDIIQQLHVANDPALRESLADAYGSRLALSTRSDEEGIDSAKRAAVEISELPDSVVGSAEAAYVQKFGSEQGGNIPDVDSVREFLPYAVTQEGKDAANAIIARDEFDRDPSSGVGMLVDTGLVERDPELWNLFFKLWLESDGIAATEYIVDLPPGESRDAAVKQTVAYLNLTGDREAARIWKEQLQPEPQE